MNPQLRVERPTWKIDNIPLIKPRTCSLRLVWDKLWPWMFVALIPLIIAALGYGVDALASCEWPFLPKV